MRLTNLYRVETPDRARVLYALMINDLSRCGPTESVIEICRRVRAFARGAGDRETLYTTFSFELDAMLEASQYRRGWDLGRRWSRAMGINIDASNPEWMTHLDWTDGVIAPLLYYNGRYRKAQAIREQNLALWLRGRAPAYDLLPRIVNLDQPPRNRYRVTLSHIYDKLDLTLSAWDGWSEFVRRLHPALLRIAGIRRAELASDAKLLPPFFQYISTEANRRRTSGVSRGQRDLVERPEVVAAAHAEIARRMEEFRNENASRRARAQADLRKYFPFVNELE